MEEKILQEVETRVEVVKEKNPTVAMVEGREIEIRTKEKRIKITRRRPAQLRGSRKTISSIVSNVGTPSTLRGIVRNQVRSVVQYIRVLRAMTAWHAIYGTRPTICQ